MRPSSADLAGIATGQVPEDFVEMFKSWRRTLNARGRSQKTIDAYEASLRYLGAFVYALGDRREAVADVVGDDTIYRLDQVTEVANVTRDHIEAFIAYELTVRASSTAHQRYRGLRAFYTWLEEREDDDFKDPMARVKPPKVDETLVPWVREPEVQKLLATCKTKSFSDRRDEAILRVMLECGPRLDEVASMRLCDVDLDGDRTARVRGKGSRERDLLLDNSTIETLSRYLYVRRRHKHAQLAVKCPIHRDASHPLWLTDKGELGYYAIPQMLRRRCAKAGIDVIHPHQLRHTWAVRELIHNPGDLIGLMRRGGWRSLSMVDAYTKAATDEISRLNRRQTSLYE